MARKSKKPTLKPTLSPHDIEDAVLKALRLDAHSMVFSAFAGSDPTEVNPGKMATLVHSISPMLKSFADAGEEMTPPNQALLNAYMDISQSDKVGDARLDRMASEILGAHICAFSKKPGEEREKYFAEKITALYAEYLPHVAAVPPLKEGASHADKFLHQKAVREALRQEGLDKLLT